MIVFTGSNSGRFTSDGTAKLIYLPTDVDWMYVLNETVSYAAGAGTGAEFYWQRGMANGQGVIKTKTAVTGALAIAQIAANSGFFLTDTSDQTPGAPVATTSISNGTPPVVATGTTTGLVSGDVVRLIDPVNALQFGGIDFTIGTIVASTSFELTYGPTIANAVGAGVYRKIPYQPLFYPRRRTISSISQAASAVVVLTVTHGFTVGQRVRFVIPAVNATYFGMTELDGVEATITAVSTANNSITVDVDTSGYTAFAWPLTTSGGFTPAQVVPVGEDTAQANSSGVSVLGDATLNQGQLGMTLAAGTASPAGANNDVIYWVAGKSFNVNNE